MPVTIVVGAQWGDEGKGRAVDWIASQSAVVARFAGGDNAGHTVNVGDDVFKMHIIPSGILREQVTCVLGNGMVINPVNLVAEIERLRDLGVEINPERLRISTLAHLITPAHVVADAVKEKARGDKAIGTTLRGIGPTYLDKTGRKGIRAEMLLDIERLAESIETMLNDICAAAESLEVEMPDTKSAVQAYVDAANALRPYLEDTVLFVNEQLEAGARVLAEGAQGTLLDVDHGSYPYVTSSSTISGGALIGLGVGPTYVDRVVGVAKSFNTRVGAGPMPTELYDDIGDRLRGTGENFWDEFGTTTGRKRRCGWLDAVLLRYALRVNGITELVITKLDILSGFDTLKIAVAYELDGERIDSPPTSTEQLEQVKPIYETMPGWSEDVTGVRSFDALPANARAYIQRIEALMGVPVSMISIGPEREQLIVR